jgi:3-oxoacyl-[acyl-carrier-protein] synthase-3
MATACAEALAKLGKGANDVDLVIPHQANLRIIEAVAKRTGVPMERVFVNVQRYGNMSAATIPVALCEALEEGRVKPGALLLMPSFGGGLTFTGHVVRWGERLTPLGTSDAELPPNNQSALAIVERYRRIKAA